eukprot:CAMPEP_0197176900 /NCGR_PEP_ID=MMETSP1423-20130617/2678_1 /TAXON_ID=476441 /ORGANISM="Pseudo-nitzschia heimii, Strain UNC1101" /LENGTH=427 /DNA_ID=CAMNT_0042626345 /DNA_START=82 /DNA_END=1365 /DNA_ORIENTATION=+
MTAEPNTSAAEEAQGEIEEFKCYIGRVPTKFTEEIIHRILVEKLKGDTTKVKNIELIYPHDDDVDGNNNNDSNNDFYRADRLKKTEKVSEKEHRGFGFVSFENAELRDSAVQLGSIRGGRKKTSKKLYTMYLRPYIAKSYEDDVGGEGLVTESRDGCEVGTASNSSSLRDICYLWNLKRCPYGERCKFRHVGEGGCIREEKDLSPEEQKRLKRKRKGKCFNYKKNGTCPKGEDCPFSHDFEPDVKNGNQNGDKERKCIAVPNSEKDCINWKTKGKCKKKDRCGYKHDPEVQKRALEKIARKKRLRSEGGDDPDLNNTKKRRKEKQPLSVRVFGLNYNSTEADVKEFIESTAGHPVRSIVFPRFEDSNRSKGYCGVYFASPKAAKAAVEKCDNAELHGRWLRVQTGKSMTIEAWETLHHNREGIDQQK